MPSIPTSRPLLTLFLTALLSACAAPSGVPPPVAETAQKTERLKDFVQKPKVPAEYFSNTQKLASYLTREAKSDIDKARALYAFVVTYVAYDVEELMSEDKEVKEPLAVLEERKALCDGYALLYQEMAESVGLNSRLVKGRVKAPVLDTQYTYEEPNHAWNLLNLDGFTYVVDSTWGAGYVNTKGKFVSQPTYQYFLTPVEETLSTHFDLDDVTGLQKAYGINRSFFEKMPPIPSKLRDLGFSSGPLIQAMQKNPKVRWVEVFDGAEELVHSVRGPVLYQLPNRSVKFRILNQPDVDLFIWANEELTPISANTEFELSPQLKGEILIMGRVKENPNDYQGVFRYFRP